MTKGFYDKFERHAHGAGVKGHATHYCPGCGHGLAHKYLAEAIEELDIADRTIMVSPVGCAVFLYFYLDTGNTQAAHGRAPAVALGHKLANPKSIVVSYQGDGDLASIGLAEILHAAQLGIPISVIFVNNAIYGMTGGQLAPTTLMGQVTSTSPEGRNLFMGKPLRMAEMIAGIDGAIYVERTALFDNKQRNRTRKAIKKALTLQVENKGFSFVEVLAECPTHLKLKPLEAETWVKENMVPVFPLGVKKDEPNHRGFHFADPSFKPTRLLDEIDVPSEKAPQFSRKFPVHLDEEDIPFKLAGAGGDGAQTAAMLLAKTAVNEGFDATHIPSYGPESRGGTSYADVHLALREVLSPGAPKPKVLLAFNAPSVQKFAPKVRPGGLVIYDSSVVEEEPHCQEGVQVASAPFARMAHDLGKPMVKNIIALGFLSAYAELFHPDSFLNTIRTALHHKKDLIPVNEKAFKLGRKAALAQRESLLVSS